MIRVFLPLRGGHAFVSENLSTARISRSDKANLEVFNESLEECDEVLSLADVARNRFFQ